MQNQSQTGRQILYPDPLLLSKSIRPSLQDQKETQKTETAWDPVGKGWLWRPFLPPAAADPGEKPSGLAFRDPPPASALVSTSCWSCFGRSPSLSSPCCGRKVQGVLAAGSSFAPPSALHTGSLSLSRICWTRAAGDGDLICAATRVGTGPPAWSTSSASPGQPLLCSSSPLCSGIPAQQVFLFSYAPVSISCLFPHSSQYLNVLPTDSNLFFKNKVGSLVSSKKYKELGLINANETYLTWLITASFWRDVLLPAIYRSAANGTGLQVAPLNSKEVGDHSYLAFVWLLRQGTIWNTTQEAHCRPV